MEKDIYIVLHHRNIKMKVKEVLSKGKYRLIDGDVVGPEDIKEIIKQNKK